jgi:hypothetical protein
LFCFVSKELHRSYGASFERRRSALTNVYNLFDHTIEQLHNIELTNGALTVLSKHLFLHLQQHLPRNNQIHGDEILYLIISTIEMLSRSAPSTFMNAFYNIKHLHRPTSSHETNNNNNSSCEGGIHFIDCLFRLLDRFESDTMQSVSKIHDECVDDDGPIIGYNNKSVQHIGRILISLSRSSEFRSVFYQNHDLVKGLTQISLFNILGNVNDIEAQTVNSECRLCRLDVLANLIKHSSNEDRVVLYQFDCFVGTLLRYANFDPVHAIRQAAAWCILELTHAPGNSFSMAQNAKVVGTLVKMILLEERATTSSSSYPIASTRESALTALQNIAFDRLNRSRIVQFKSGLVLEALKKVLTSDIDAKTRRRAAGTVVNLVGEDTAELMVSYKGLPDTLALVATQDDNTDVQNRAALSLTKLAVHVADLQGDVSELSANYLTVLDALVVASLSKAHCTRVTTVIRSLARNHVTHRPLLARHDGVVDTLVDVIQASVVDIGSQKGIVNNDFGDINDRKRSSTVSDRANAIHAMAHLVNSDDATRQLLCNRRTLVTAVVHATQTLDTQDMAVLVLERLAIVPSNRFTLAHCNGLLVAVAEAVERENRREKHRKNGVATGTSPSSENRYDNEDECSNNGKSVSKGSGAYLAKPLLMSLLLAM